MDHTTICNSIGQSLKPLTGGGQKNNANGDYILVFSFDDGNVSQYKEAFPYMKANGYKGTAYVIGNAVGVEHDVYFNWEEAKEMYEAGWDIANHGKTHKNFIDLSLKEVEDELLECQSKIELHVGDRGSRHVAYPFGGHNDNVDKAMASTRMLTGRDAVGSSFSFDGLPDYRHIPSVSVSENTPINNIKNLIDDVVENKKILVLQFHGIMEKPTGPHISINKFREIVDWVSSKDYQLSSISDLYDLAYT